MPAIITDQFRIINANNFVEDVTAGTNSYYTFLSLANPTAAGFGRTDTWNSTTVQPPSPEDSINYTNHLYDTMLFGRKVFPGDVRRLIRKNAWTKGTSYDMYRHDYSVLNRSLVSNSSRLYSANYYVINSDFRVYVCIDNGSAGISSSANASLDEPTFTDLEPAAAGVSGDGYLWKYLFTVPPADIVKFDSTEYIAVPNNWATSVSNDIKVVRDNGDSEVNDNQIKVVSIDEAGEGYSFLSSPIEVDIVGDGTGAKVRILTNTNGQIISAQVTNGGKGYSFARVDLSSINASASKFAKLTPIIPPSRGHGYDLYKELGADRVMIYSRFDDSSRDFPINTKFCQIGILKNPSRFISTETFTNSEFSGLYAINFSSVNDTLPIIGEKIIQTNTGAVGYVASYDSDTKILKYFKDRSLHYGPTYDQTDYVGVSTGGNANIDFSNAGGNIIGQNSSFVGQISSFSGITTTVNNSIINLGVTFTDGLANPEINKKTGDIIYIDNRPLVSRNIRQKEDIKIILEF